MRAAKDWMQQLAGLPPAARAVENIHAALRGRSALSACQLRVWQAESMRGPTNKQNISFDMTLRGELDQTLLEAALHDVIAAHPMLRTRFALDGAQPAQIVEESAQVKLICEDLSDLTLTQSCARARELATRQATRSFDVQQLPLLAAQLVRIGSAQYRLQLNFHHLIFDSQSFTIFFDELVRAYEARAMRQALPERSGPSYQYVDSILQQQRWLFTEAARAQRAFWRQYLHGGPEQLLLPGQSAWPRASQCEPTCVYSSVPGPMLQALAALARSQGGRLFDVLYGAFALLLGRLSGQNDLNIGIAVDGRDPETRGVIGNFLNTLPVRNRLWLERPFTDYLHAQIRNLEQVLSNQDYPFDRILEEVAAEHACATTPLFRVFFDMLSPAHRTQFQLIKVEPEDAAELDPRFDLTLQIEETGRGVELACHYDKEEFTYAAIAHLTGQYRSLLEQIANDPRRPCGDYSLRPDTAREALCNPTCALFAGARSDFGTELTSRLEEVVPCRYLPARILSGCGIESAVTYFEASSARDYSDVVPAAEAAAADGVIDILNGNGVPCGLGEVGHIHIEDGPRRSRTDELGCRLPGGVVLVLGRRNNQIDIRELRIEAGEINSSARSVHAVEDAVA